MDYFFITPKEGPKVAKRGKKWQKKIILGFSCLFLIKNLKCHLLPPPTGHVWDLNGLGNTPIRSASGANSLFQSSKVAQNVNFTIVLAKTVHYYKKTD